MKTTDLEEIFLVLDRLMLDGLDARYWILDAGWAG